MIKAIKCPYCERLISEKTMKDHLNVNEFFCKLKHNNFMNNCSTMKDAFTSKMDKVVNIIRNNFL